MKPKKRYRADRARRYKHRRQNGPKSWTFTLLIGLALLGWVGFYAAERYPEYFGLVVTVTSVRSFQGLVTHVRDGDTIEVESVPIRFGSLDCPEMNTSAGQRAAARMQSLVAGEILSCYLNERTSYERKIGSCRLPDGRDIGAVMLREGLCRRF